MTNAWSRRDLGASLLAAGAGGVFASKLGGAPALAAAPLETTTIRLPKSPGICVAPVYAAEAALRLEGFTEPRFVSSGTGVSVIEMVTRGELDLAQATVPTLVYELAQGRPIVCLAGVHSGCYELFVHGDIATVSELRGQRVAIQAQGAHAQYYLSAMAAHVGLDPQADIDWRVPEGESALELFARGGADAFMAFAPEPQELRARGVGRVILNTATDRPWSQYFCCMIYGNPNWARHHPKATKAAIRAFLKTADWCAADPAAVARHLVAEGFAADEAFAAEALAEIPYTRWHEFDVEDSMRFYALRLHEAGLVTMTPQQIIAEGADWRHFEALKRELRS
jgi:NitT/TauT family transport system substrate-binding protein